MQARPRLKIAVVGAGISGLASAWLLNRAHDVTVYERAEKPGGHANTVSLVLEGKSVPVDTGFIVFNHHTYPNLTALFKHLDVPTRPTQMSFAVSLEDGAIEYAAGTPLGLMAQPGRMFTRRYGSMLADLVRFYRQASRDAGTLPPDLTLGDYLSSGHYGEAFCGDHLLPMAGAIWSATPDEIRAFPADAFLRFHANHGLLKLWNRPVWRSVMGGSGAYVARLADALAGRIRLESVVASILRRPDGVIVTDMAGRSDRYDHVIIASHADQALSMLADPDPAERELLGGFRYSRNFAVLHSDASFMPRRRAAWASWNYLGPGQGEQRGVNVTYWMNRLQNLPTRTPLFVTLNPRRAPRHGTLHHSEVYEHPVFDAAALAAQTRLWSLQGRRNTWFCGAWFGAGFHEDGLQAGLAVAEQLGGVRRPWNVANESGRIQITSQPAAPSVEDVIA